MEPPCALVVPCAARKRPPSQRSHWRQQTLGHFNNKAFLTYAESARAAFMLETGLWVPGGSRQSVLARLELDYRRELHYPGDVRVGMNVLSVGGSSFTLGIGLFDGDSCAATMTTLMVRIDMHSRQSVPLDDDERAALQPYRVDQPAYVIASDGFGSHPNG